MKDQDMNKAIVKEPSQYTRLEQLKERMVAFNKARSDALDAVRAHEQTRPELADLETWAAELQRLNGILIAADYQAKMAHIEYSSMRARI